MDKQRIVVILSSHGESGFGIDGVYASKNHLNGMLIDALHLLGLEDVRCIGAEFDEMHGELHSQSVTKASQAIERLVGSMTQQKLDKKKAA